MQMGGVGRGAPSLIKPVADIAQKQAKAGNVKSIKVKMKFDPKAKPGGK